MALEIETVSLVDRISMSIFRIEDNVVKVTALFVFLGGKFACVNLNPNILNYHNYFLKRGKNEKGDWQIEKTLM